MTDDRRDAEPLDASASDRITSLANARVKAAVRLRDRGERDATNLTIVDGAREILRAIETGAPIETAFVAPELIRTGDARAVLDRIRGAATTIDVSPAVLAKLAYGDRSDGVVAIVAIPELGLDRLVLPAEPLVVVAEAVEKPGNLGAILRSADAAGAAAFIAADPLTDVFNPNAIRASVGAIFGVPIAVATAAETRDWLLDHGITPIAAIVDADKVYTAADLSGPVAIVLGSEATGLSGTWRDPRVVGVSIPMGGIADSLNVSVAAAVLLFEAVRQRAGRPRSVMSDPAN